MHVDTWVTVIFSIFNFNSHPLLSSSYPPSAQEAADPPEKAKEERGKAKESKRVAAAPSNDDEAKRPALSAAPAKPAAKLPSEVRVC